MFRKLLTSLTVAILTVLTFAIFMAPKANAEPLACVTYVNDKGVENDACEPVTNFCPYDQDDYYYEKVEIHPSTAYYKVEWCPIY